MENEVRFMCPENGTYLATTIHIAVDLLFKAWKSGQHAFICKVNDPEIIATV